MIPTLAAVLSALEAHYGPPPLPEPADPYEQALWIACAYLVDDERRRATFQALREAVGLSPTALLAAEPAALEAAIARGGMKPAMRAEKLRQVARIALAAGVDAPGALAARAAEDPAAALRILRRCPGVSAVVARRILVNAGCAAGLPLESNGLRVLLRLGFGEEAARWEASLASAVGAVVDPPQTPGESARALALLRAHGQSLCRSADPACAACPLASGCPCAAPPPSP